MYGQGLIVRNITSWLEFIEYQAIREDHGGTREKRRGSEIQDLTLFDEILYSLRLQWVCSSSHSQSDAFFPHI